MAQKTPQLPRKLIPTRATDRKEDVPAAIRVLLAELHQGKCQLCSFTFEKKSGGPYFEIHHLNPEIGHHPLNILVVCANCHAQFEHARLTDFELVAGWLVALKMNGQRVAVRQPLLTESQRGIISALRLCILAISAGVLLAPALSG
jgi:hypothetical protein